MENTNLQLSIIRQGFAAILLLPHPPLFSFFLDFVKRQLNFEAFHTAYIGRGYKTPSPRAFRGPPAKFPPAGGPLGNLAGGPLPHSNKTPSPRALRGPPAKIPPARALLRAAPREANKTPSPRALRGPRAKWQTPAGRPSAAPGRRLPRRI